MIGNEEFLFVLWMSQITYDDEYYMIYDRNTMLPSYQQIPCSVTLFS